MELRYYSKITDDHLERIMIKPVVSFTGCCLKMNTQQLKEFIPKLVDLFKMLQNGDKTNKLHILSLNEHCSGTHILEETLCADITETHIHLYRLEKIIYNQYDECMQQRRDKECVLDYLPLKRHKVLHLISLLEKFNLVYEVVNKDVVVLSE
jgi:hypothetical protein